MAKLAKMPEEKILLNPGMAEIYRARVATLHEALQRPDADCEVAEPVRSLVEKVVLVPADGRLAIDLYGELGSILKLTAAKQGRSVLGPVSEQLVVVAGVGFEPTTFRL